MPNDRTVSGWFNRFTEGTGSAELAIILLTAAAIVAAVILHAIAFAILRRVFDEDGPGRHAVQRVRGLTRLAAILLALFIVLPAADFDPAIAETARHALKIGMAVLLGWSGVAAIGTVSGWIERRHRIDVADNLEARRIHTQIKILRRTGIAIVVLFAAGAVLITFPAVRAFGVSFFASAGLAGLVLGFAARPILTNLIAGIQVALTQPIRIDDVVIVEGEWGWVEEIKATYVVIRIWDWRRLIVPLSNFIEKPFENWTRETASIIGTVFWHVDYRAPIGEMRAKLEELAAANPRWDKDIVNLQVVDSGQATITVRALLSARSSPEAWDLRCEIREAMLTWLREEHPEALPRVRAIVGQPKMDNPALDPLAR
ncbi:MAG: mechanosensitive ion channel family protein [Minwuia sp.]|uniref:mechanosensitive ion channel family protein n=1 Tax=Minwuia sp. TaxID=2493630 RepID=UPI003A8B4F64